MSRAFWWGMAVIAPVSIMAFGLVIPMLAAVTR